MSETTKYEAPDVISLSEDDIQERATCRTIYCAQGVLYSSDQPPAPVICPVEAHYCSVSYSF